jgi:hypothetical protein
MAEVSLMSVLSKAIAHVSFPGGGMFLPARSPYDRQMLVEHVTNRVRSKGRVQVLLDEQRWMVYLNRGPRTACSNCGRAADSACCRPADAGAAYCLGCALGPAANLSTAHQVPHRHAS